MPRLGIPTLIVSDTGRVPGLARRPSGQSGGVWLVLAKKDTTDPTSLTYAQALEEALCQGWIDGQKRSRDATTFAQRFTPRRRTSQWSKRNVDLAEGLIADGRMLPAGLVEIERAKADGRWAAAYSGQAAATVPADLATALAGQRCRGEDVAALNGATGTRSCTASRRRSVPKRPLVGSTNWWRCLPEVKRSIPRSSHGRMRRSHAGGAVGRDHARTGDMHSAEAMSCGSGG